MENNENELKILFVEDIPEDAEIAVRELKKNGLKFSFIRVDTKHEFIHALENFIPDIIISDFSMPQFDGMSALKISLTYNPLLPFIVLTGSINENTAVTCMKAGATDYVLKEYIIRLPFAIKEALENFKSRKEKEETIKLLLESEKRYHSLFDNMMNGIAYCQSIFDQGKAVDFIYISVNKSFEKLTGLSNVVGRKVSEVIPGILEKDTGLIEIYGRVAITGSPEHFEMFLTSMQMWFSVSVYCPRREFFIAIFDVITERKQAEEKLLKSLREKETLIRELYHRTKNTMQLIHSMLMLQAVEFSDSKEVQKLVKITDDRIQAISLVHKMLYESQDLSKISIKEYIHELSSLIMKSFGISDSRILLNIQVDDLFFLLDTAIPLGLILNELITNSLKYAFPENRKGTISIELKKIDMDNNLLHYSDNGIGAPSGFNFKNQKSLGLKLIYSIGEQQMMGKVKIENSNGVVCLFKFPANLYKVRI